MNQSTIESAATVTPQAFPKKARVAPRKPHVAPPKARSGRKASPKKTAPKAAPKTKGARQESTKTRTILDLLKRPGGARLTEIMQRTNWQAHSVRGFISGTLRKKMGLTVISIKNQDGDRSYSIEV